MRSFIAMLSFIVLFLPARAQTPELVKIGDIVEIMTSKSDKILVINFWATWCAPCIKELPLFESLNANRTDVDVYLVSVDIDLDPNPDKVKRFVTRKKLKSNVYILDEVDPNSWIEKIDKNWSGAIPATLIHNSATGKRMFIERELKEGDLDKLIESVKEE